MLQWFISRDDVYSHIIGHEQADRNLSYLSDYCDGDAFQSDQFFVTNRYELRIHM